MIFRKLAVIIPAFNEALTIGEVIRSIPRRIEGIEQVSVLVIDDGSADDTVNIAKSSGADTVVALHGHKGLAATFSAGLAAALHQGADVIVNIDADGQYEAGEIPALIEPILSDHADISIGDRKVASLAFMPPLKRYGNRFGSAVVRWLSGSSVADASSGFRALNAEAAKRLNTFAEHTYTHESIIDAASRGLRISNVPCTFRPTKRAGGRSRLISSVFGHIRLSLYVIVRAFVLYRPLRAFLSAGSVFVGFGLLIGLRFLYYYAMGNGQGKVQSLILAAASIIVGFQIMAMGFLAHAMAVNRKILDDISYRLKNKRSNNDA